MKKGLGASKLGHAANFKLTGKEEHPTYSQSDGEDGGGSTSRRSQGGTASQVLRLDGAAKGHKNNAKQGALETKKQKKKSNSVVRS